MDRARDKRNSIKRYPKKIGNDESMKPIMIFFVFVPALFGLLLLRKLIMEKSF